MGVFKSQRKDNITDLEQRVALVPDNAQFHFELALHYSKQGRHINAINEYKLAVALDPSHGEYHRRLSAAYVKAGRHQKAEQQGEILRRLEAVETKSGQ